MRLFLIGLPGSGKSTIGKDLSLLLNMPLLDTDIEICNREQMTVEEIFANKGEAYFRELERNLLGELVQSYSGIISTGGGLPCFFDNMDVINKNGVGIFLNVSPTDITERLWNTENHNRPMLKGKTKQNVFDFIEGKHKERFPFYSKAIIQMEGNFITGTAVFEELTKRGLVTTK